MANTAQLCGLWSPAAIFGRPQTHSRTSSTGQCSSTFTVHCHILKICIFFGYQQYRSDQKWQTVERRTFRVTIPTYPVGFGTEQTFCSAHRVWRRSNLFVVSMFCLQVLPNHPIRDHCSCAMNGKYLLKTLLSHSM